VQYQSAQSTPLFRVLVSEESPRTSYISIVITTADGQDSELQNIYSFAPLAPQDQVLDKARTAYLKATGAISDESKESKESVEDTSNGKRKDAAGEDCPVYVSSFFLLIVRFNHITFPLNIFHPGNIIREEADSIAATRK
jgi:hypothetical protein